MENADKGKYESILKNLNQHQYPQTITEANNILSNHKFDETYNKNRQAQKDHYTDKINKEVQNYEPISRTSVQIEGRCHCCGKSCHIVN